MENPGRFIVHVVDDDEAVRDSMRALLESYDIVVRDYASAGEFLAGQPSSPGCVLLDLHMPGMSGMELLERLQDQGSKLSVIAITGRGDSTLKERTIRAGALTLLEKPVRDDQLVATLARALGLARSRDAEPLRIIP